MVRYLSLAVAALSLGAVKASPLVDFQVAQPPPVPADAKQCTVELIQSVDVDSISQ